MHPEQLDPLLDEWLDKAAARFGRAKVDPGFENRVLAKVHSATRRRSRIRDWRLLAAAAALAIALSVWVFQTSFWNRGAQEIKSAANIEREVRPKTQVGHQHPGTGLRTKKPPTSASRKIAVTGIRNPRQQLVRQAVFPSYSFSDEDRLLFAYAQAVSAGIAEPIQQGAAALDIPKLLIPPLEIPKLQITPIVIESLTDESNTIRK